MRDGGGRASGGQLVRFVDISADAGAGLGVLNRVPKKRNGTAVGWFYVMFTGGLPILIYVIMMFVLPVVQTRNEYDASLRTHVGAV